MADEAENQRHFEELFDFETLHEPLDEADSEYVAELLMDLQQQTRLLFTRARNQYQGDTWISNELWMAFMETEQLWARFQQLYDSNVFQSPSVRK